MELILLVILFTVPIEIATSSTRRRPSTHQNAYPIAVQLFSARTDLAGTIAQRCQMTLVANNVGNPRTFLFFDPITKTQNDIGTFKCLESFFEVEWFAEQGPRDESRNFYKLYSKGEFKRWPTAKNSFYLKLHEFRRELVHWTVFVKESILYVVAVIGGFVLSLFGL